MTYLMTDAFGGRESYRFLLEKQCLVSFAVTDCLETETQTERDAVQNSLQTIKQILLHKVGYTGENHTKYRPFLDRYASRYCNV